MTTKRARKILGQAIKHLTDEEVERFIARSAALIDTVLDMYEAKELKGGSYATKIGFDFN